MPIGAEFVADRQLFLKRPNFIESISLLKIANRPISATGNQVKLIGTRNSSNVENIDIIMIRSWTSSPEITNYAQDTKIELLKDSGGRQTSEMVSQSWKASNFWHKTSTGAINDTEWVEPFEFQHQSLVKIRMIRWISVEFHFKGLWDVRTKIKWKWICFWI